MKYDYNKAVRFNMVSDLLDYMFSCSDYDDVPESEFEQLIYIVYDNELGVPMSSRSYTLY